ncbi:MAG: OmpA family protein [Proteobacteria bacterium]|nr:OmpA family protein [Pseudomonadota bacterium]
MVRSLVMTSVVLVMLVLLGAGLAEAQPVTFRLRGEVPVGQKPILELTAVQPVTDVRVELDRDDGKHFALKQAALAKGKVVQLPIGDGAAGKATYKGTIAAKGPDGAWRNELNFDTAVIAPIKVTYDAEHLDLDKRVLQFKVSRAVDKADLVVIGEDGKELGKGTATFPAGSLDRWLAITWSQPPTTRVMMMKLRVAAADGAATNVELIPWSLEVDHEDVNFSSDQAVIEPSETGKLDASLGKIADAVKRTERVLPLTLYIAGHTDTVGPTAKNQKLSLDRARAIGAYFRKKGLAIKIVFAGFGEEVLKVKTAQEVDERANRRVDYVLGPAGGAPPFKGAYAKVHVDWRQLK